MVVTEVADIQQVTTRSKGKTTEWEAQEAIRKQTTEWIEKANKHNATEIKEQTNEVEELTKTAQPKNPAWQALQKYQFTLPLGRLLQLMPRFTDGLKSALAPSSLALALAFFSNSEEGLAVMNTSNSAITAIIKGGELSGTIVNGGLGVNMISLRTCNT